MALVPPPKNCDASVRRAIQKLAYKLGPKGHPTFAGLILNDQAIADDARGLSSITKLVTNAKSDGIAGYFEGHIDGTTDGPTYAVGAWLNVDSGSITTDIRALDIGIYESGANCSGGNAYGLAIHMEFDNANSPAAIYPFRLNTNVAGATPDALIFAANKKAIAVTEDGFPGLANAYMKIVVQDGTVYRIPVIDENNISGAIIDDLDTLGAPASDGQFIVATGAGVFAYESGATARTSLGLGTGNSPVLTGLTLSGLTQGSVLFAGASGVISQDNDKLFWDATNFRLGIGTATPDLPLHVESALNNVAKFVSTDNRASIKVSDDTTSTCLGAENGISWFGRGVALATTNLNINASGDVGIGTIAPGEKLEIVGSAFITNGIELGHASDTTITRASAGNLNIENNIIYRANGTDVPIGDGGTGQSTAQAAIDALTAVAGATNEHVLTKDTGTGNAVFKVAAAAVDEKVGIDADAAAGYLGAAFNDGILRTSSPIIYTDGGDFITLSLDAGLTDLAGIAMAADRFYYTSGDNTHVAGTVTAFARSILDDADEATFKGTVNLEIGTDVLAEQTIGIADDNLVEIDHADNGGVANDDYAKFTANGLEGRSYIEVKTDLSLNLVENTALSTWAGTTNITTLGTIATVGDITIADGGIIRCAGAPVLTFDDTNDFLEITGCNVGIGTASPGQKLEVIGNLKLYAATGNSPSILTYSGSIYTDTYYNLTDDTMYVQLVGSAAGKIVFRQVNSGARFDLLSTGFFSLNIGGFIVPNNQPYQGTLVAGTPVNLMKLANDDVLYIGSGGVTTTSIYGGSTNFLQLIQGDSLRSLRPIKILEQANADADTEAYGQIWVKTATPNQLWFTDDGGTDHQLAFV